MMPMAPIDFLSLIAQGATHWNQWRADHPALQPDLSNAYLFGQALAGFNLSNVNLERACLIGADLRGANLQHARMQATYASDADFSRADLRGATLSLGSFSSANFSGANLSGAQAQGANFSNGHFTGACLSAWQIAPTTVLAGVQGDYIYLASSTSESQITETTTSESETLDTEAPDITQERQPLSGIFQPGALEPFLRLVALQQSAIPSSLAVGSLSLTSRLQALIKQANIRQAGLKPTALKQLGSFNLSQISQVKALSQQITSNAQESVALLLNSATANHLKILFRPDAADRVTPGALNQLSPEQIARLDQLLCFDRIPALKHRTQQLSKGFKTSAVYQAAAMLQSTILNALHLLIQSQWAKSQAVSQVVYLFTPDAVGRVTPGVFGYIWKLDQKSSRIEERSIEKRSIDQFTKVAIAHICTLFTPDTVGRVTPGKLNQLSPETLARLRSLQQTITTLQQRTGQIGQQAKVIILIPINALIHSPPMKPLGIATHTATHKLLATRPISQLTHLLQPDAVGRVTPGRWSPADVDKLIQTIQSHLQTGFTPDATDRVTPGALNQLSPETLERFYALLPQQTICTLTQRTCQINQQAKTIAAKKIDAIAHSAAVDSIHTLAKPFLQSKPVTSITQHFQPDAVDRVTLGLWVRVAPQLSDRIVNSAASKITSQIRSSWNSQGPIPSHVKRYFSKVYTQRPLVTGLGATAVLALLALNLGQRSEQAPAITLEPAAPPADPSPESTTPNSPALNVASMVMPCQALTLNAKRTPLSDGYLYEDGAIYYGPIQAGQPADGPGTMVYPTGNRYDGDYQGGKRQGCGTFTFANGRQYIGQFEADQFAGRGTWIIENGERYIGEFKDNQCNGQGTFIFANGSSESGTWVKGKLAGSTLSCDRGSLDLPSSQDM